MIATVDKKMANLRSSPRATDRPAIGSPNDNQTVIHLPDQTGRAYKVARHCVMRDRSPALNVGHDRFEKVAYLNTKTDGIRDAVFMQDNIIVLWAQL